MSEDEGELVPVESVLSFRTLVVAPVACLLSFFIPFYLAGLPGRFWGAVLVLGFMGGGVYLVWVAVNPERRRSFRISVEQGAVRLGVLRRPRSLVTPLDTWFRIEKLEGRRISLVTVELATNRIPLGSRVDMEVRFTWGDDDTYLPSRDPAYAGAGGELLLRQRSKILGPDETVKLGAAAPVQAWEIVPGLKILEGRMEIQLSCGGEVHDVLRRGFKFLVLSGDVEALPEGEDRCPVCRESLERDATPCLACQAHQHRVCRKLVGRCSTWGCDGKPKS